MNAEILKEYNLGQLNEISKNYKFVMIEDINGKKITTWNKATTPIGTHLKECIKRLKMDIIPQGYYYFCFATAPSFFKDSADKYIYLKGKPPAEGQQLKNGQDNLPMNKNDLLSVTSALGYITQIAELKTEVNRLTMEVTRLKDENAILEAELEEAEREEEGLSKGQPSGTLEYLKDQAPALMALADRFFDQRDKALALEEKRLITGNNGQPIKKRIIKKIAFEIASPEHIKHIRHLFEQNKEEALNLELDKLEQANPELYLQICTELNLLEDETDNGN